MGWKDKEKKREYQRRWRKENPDKAREDPEKVRERNRLRYIENRDSILAAQKEYREANKEVIYAKQKEYRENNRQLISARNRLKKYGIKPDEFSALVGSQDGKCAICEDVLDVDGYRKIHVDHCHSTDVVRSVLCSGCNVGLGHFRENPNILRKAADYAERFANLSYANDNAPTDANSKSA